MGPSATSSSIAKRFDPKVLALLGGLDLKARYIVEGFLAGLHEGPFHGFSVEFSEYREYQPGDDLRHIDWRVFARTDRLYVKQFTEETNTRFYVICDTSSSMAYRGRTAWGSKLECAQLLAAALTLLMLRQNDAVGLLTLRDDGVSPKFIRPSQKSHHFGLMLRSLERLTPAGGGSRLATLLDHAARLVHRRSMIVFLSDLLEPAETIEDGLRHLRFLGHECLLFQVLDRDEVEFPFGGAAVFEDLESGERRRVSPRAAREKYLERFAAFMAGHREMFQTLEIPHCVIHTDEDPWQGLAKFLVERKRLK
jgi:uncharacterized protein (DUF58 family)